MAEEGKIHSQYIVL